MPERFGSGAFGDFLRLTFPAMLRGGGNLYQRQRAYAQEIHSPENADPS